MREGFDTRCLISWCKLVVMLSSRWRQCTFMLVCFLRVVKEEDRAGAVDRRVLLLLAAPLVVVN